MVAKTAAIFAFLAMLAIVEAQQHRHRRAHHQPSACATSDSTLPQDTLLEGFQGLGYENTWSENLGSGGSVLDEDADSSSLTTSKPTGACNTALNIAVDGVLNYVSWDSGSAQVYDFDFIFYLYFSTLPDNGESFKIFTVNNSTNPANVVRTDVTLANSSGTSSITAVGDTSSASRTVVVGQWYKVKLHIDATAANSYMEVDDEGTSNAFTRDTGGSNWRYVHIGGTRFVGSGENADFYADLIAVDDASS